MTRTKKRIWVCVVASLLSALSTRIWPDDAATLQMGAYSALVLGLLTIGFAEDRRRPRFWPAVLLVLLVHAVLLRAGRTFFPVKTTFLLWIAAGVEGTLLGLLMVWVLGKWHDSVQEKDKRRLPRVSGGRIGR